MSIARSSREFAEKFFEHLGALGMDFGRSKDRTSEDARRTLEMDILTKLDEIVELLLEIRDNLDPRT